jgi:hypothetical protein
MGFLSPTIRVDLVLSDKTVEHAIDAETDLHLFGSSVDREAVAS